MDFMVGHAFSYWMCFAFSQIACSLFLAARNFAGTLWSVVTQKPWGCPAASFTSTFYSVPLFVCIPELLLFPLQLVCSLNIFPQRLFKKKKKKVALIVLLCQVNLIQSQNKVGMGGNIAVRVRHNDPCFSETFIIWWF